MELENEKHLCLPRSNEFSSHLLPNPFHRHFVPHFVHHLWERTIEQPSSLRAIIPPDTSFAYVPPPPCHCHVSLVPSGDTSFPYVPPHPDVALLTLHGPGASFSPRVLQPFFYLPQLANGYPRCFPPPREPRSSIVPALGSPSDFVTRKGTVVAEEDGLGLGDKECRAGQEAHGRQDPKDGGRLAENNKKVCLIDITRCWRLAGQSCFRARIVKRCKLVQLRFSDAVAGTGCV